MIRYCSNLPIQKRGMGSKREGEPVEAHTVVSRAASRAAKVTGIVVISLAVGIA
jgi:hypothetical protein